MGRSVASCPLKWVRDPALTAPQTGVPLAQFPPASRERALKANWKMAAAFGMAQVSVLRRLPEDHLLPPHRRHYYRIEGGHL
jgi:hypothetical protein